MARDSVPSILRVYHTVNSTTQMPSTMLKYESCVAYSLLVHTAYATVMMTVRNEAPVPLSISPKLPVSPPYRSPRNKKPGGDASPDRGV